MTSFDLAITYSQIAVFNSDMDEPFNDWTDDLVNQGFSWRDGSVSFKTIASDSKVRVEFEVASEFMPAKGSDRAISVPFECPHGEIEIASITDSQPISVEVGVYQLIFECGAEPDDWCRITMIPNGDLEPRILLADAEINPHYPLIMEAQVA